MLYVVDWEWWGWCTQGSVTQEKSSSSVCGRTLRPPRNSTSTSLNRTVRSSCCSSSACSCNDLQWARGNLYGDFVNSRKEGSIMVYSHWAGQEPRQEQGLGPEQWRHNRSRPLLSWFRCNMKVSSFIQPICSRSLLWSWFRPVWIRHNGCEHLPVLIVTNDDELVLSVQLDHLLGAGINYVKYTEGPTYIRVKTFHCKRVLDCNRAVASLLWIECKEICSL